MSDTHFRSILIVVLPIAEYYFRIKLSLLLQLLLRALDPYALIDAGHEEAVQQRCRDIHASFLGSPLLPSIHAPHLISRTFLSLR